MAGAVPPPAARPLERAARVPRPVCPGCGRCGRVDPAPAPQRAPLRAGVARCGGGGRASRGGVPSTVVRGAWCQALSLPRPPVLWSGQPGFPDPCVPGAVDAGVWTQHRPHGVRPCGPALLAVGVAEGRPRVGRLPPCCEGCLVSGAVPPPAARPLERAARVPRPVCPGCGRCGRVNPAPAPQRAPLRAGAARCGGGGRASPGGPWAGGGGGGGGMPGARRRSPRSNRGLASVWFLAAFGCRHVRRSIGWRAGLLVARLARQPARYPRPGWSPGGKVRRWQWRFFPLRGCPRSFHGNDPGLLALWHGGQCGWCGSLSFFGCGRTGLGWPPMWPTSARVPPFPSATAGLAAVVPPSGCGTPVGSSWPGSFALGPSAETVACVVSGSGSGLGAG